MLDEFWKNASTIPKIHLEFPKCLENFWNASKISEIYREFLRSSKIQRVFLKYSKKILNPPRISSHSKLKNATKIFEMRQKLLQCNEIFVKNFE